MANSTRKPKIIQESPLPLHQENFNKRVKTPYFFYEIQSLQENSLNKINLILVKLCTVERDVELVPCCGILCSSVDPLFSSGEKLESFGGNHRGYVERVKGLYWKNLSSFEACLYEDLQLFAV